MTTNVAKLKKTYPEVRKQAVKLNDDDKHKLYKYVVEQHCLAQDGELYKFRVKPKDIAEEINKCGLFGGRKISPYHVKDAVEEVIDWQVRLSKLPVQPIETAELEQLKIFKIKAVKEIEDLKLLVSGKEAENTGLKAAIERLRKTSGAQVKLDKIKSILES